MKTRITDVVKALEEAKEDYDSTKTDVEQKLLDRPRADQTIRQKAPYLTNGVSEHDEHQTDLHAIFKYQRRLGRGSQGEVHEVKEATTNIFYARKQIYSVKTLTRKRFSTRLPSCKSFAIRILPRYNSL